MKLFELYKENLPSVKTHGVNYIAKHHKVSVAQIRQQLKKGINVELEHTKNKSIAREIALDHLLELPDYYDRLEKAEKEK